MQPPRYATLFNTTSASLVAEAETASTAKTTTHHLVVHNSGEEIAPKMVIMLDTVDNAANAELPPQPVTIKHPTFYVLAELSPALALSPRLVPKTSTQKSAIPAQ